MKKFLDIIDRLNDPEKAIDAIDDAVNELLRVRGLLYNIIECYDKEYDKFHLENALDNAREYMRGK